MYYNRMSCVNVKSKKTFVIWQKVDGNEVTYVDENDQDYKLPKEYEGDVVAAELERPE